MGGRWGGLHRPVILGLAVNRSSRDLPGPPGPGWALPESPPFSSAVPSQMVPSDWPVGTAAGQDSVHWNGLFAPKLTLCLLALDSEGSLVN